MPMRAVTKHGGKRAIEADSEPPVRPEDIPQDDGIVPVLFPRQTWDKVQKMAEVYKIRPAEVLILALENLDREIRGKKDGA